MKTSAAFKNRDTHDNAQLQKFLEAIHDEALLIKLFIEMSNAKYNLETWKTIIANVFNSEAQRNTALMECLKSSFSLHSRNSIQEQAEAVSIIDFIVRLLPKNSGEEKDENTLLLHVCHQYEKYFWIYYRHDRENLDKRYLELIQILIEKNHVSNDAVHSIYFSYQFLKKHEETQMFSSHDFFNIIIDIPRVKLEHAINQGYDHFEKIILNYTGDPQVKEYLLHLERDYLGTLRFSVFKDFWLQSEIRKKFYAVRTEPVCEEKKPSLTIETNQDKDQQSYPTSPKSPLLSHHFLARPPEKPSDHDQSLKAVQLQASP